MTISLSAHGARIVSAEASHSDDAAWLSLRIETGDDSLNVTAFFRGDDAFDLARAYADAINRVSTPRIVQVGDHPPEHSPDTSKIVSIGDFDPVYQRKLDAVAGEIGGPQYDGAA